MKYKNLVDMVSDRRKKDAGITFIDGVEKQRFLSYDDLYREAGAVLFNLQSIGLTPGDQLVFQLNDHRDFIMVFWACLLGKIIPVPVTLASNDDYRLKLFNIWNLLSRPHLITAEKNMETLKGFAADSNKLKMIERMERCTIFTGELERSERHGKVHIPDESDIAYIQFSSGSTGSPKGVILTHNNLLSNIYAILKGFKDPEAGGDRYFSWMPLTHDMGLIGFHLTPLVGGWAQALMDTQLFVRYPRLWLEGISKLKSTLTSSPNFGYKYVLKHFRSLKNQNLDLSSIRIIVNGAEPISPSLCDEFLTAMAPFGLRRNAVLPAYGLAEASVAVTITDPRDKILPVHLDRDSLYIGKKVRERDGDNDPGVVSFVEVGVPVQDCSVKTVDEKGNTCEDNVVGEILIRGDNVTSGYFNDSEATSKVITPDGWLRTGDLGFFREGRLVITGRSKDIIFANGQNYYPHDLERTAVELEGIGFEKIAACGIYSQDLQMDEIICFVVFRRQLKEFLPLAAALKNHIMKKMALEVSRVIPVKKIPKTTSGKIQRFKLRKEYLEGLYNPVVRQMSALQEEIYASKQQLTETEIRKIIVETWRQVLGTGDVGEDDNFFEYGWDSAQAVRIKARLQELLGKPIDDAALFKYPTINALAGYLCLDDAGVKFSSAQRERLDLFSENRQRIRERIKQSVMDGSGKTSGRNGLEVAVIGMAGKFPGAKNINEFWDNLKNGIESITFFSDEELIECGIEPQHLANPDYVKAKGVLEDVEYFDAAFFGYTPMEAGEMDPQTRIFHECLWEALEDAGYDPGIYRGLIGVYAGASPNPAWDSRSILSGKVTASQQFADTQLVDKDFMTTRISYKLNLKGPSFTMYTACSTSLVAIDLACQGLLTGKCDMALAGGVSVWLPHKSGYLYEEEMIFSRDGHNRTFDERASGIIFSDGAGIAALKRLEDALDDGDHIYAVIKGSAINNDGNRKAGYTAPALEGQAEVIAAAQQMAGIEPESIGYVEAHGTATALGDPIEIEALSLAFHTDKKRYCAIGSVKSNIGHLNSAAGVAGFIKTVLSLHHRMIPPCLFFQKPNPGIDFDNSPFYVNTQLQEWKTRTYPPRAGVSSFGIGGTNCHVILEGFPGNRGGEKGRSPSEERPYKLILLSAKTKPALDSAAGNLGDYFKNNPGINLADAAYTLQVGRKAFKYRGRLVCSGVAEAVDALSAAAEPNLAEPANMMCASVIKNNPPVIFMFSGQGSQYVNMGLELYRQETLFRGEIDRCFDILESIMGENIKNIIYPDSEHHLEEAERRINDVIYSGPVKFVFEYAMAKLLMNWGIHPDAMIGHSFGEYAAACLAGVFSLEDALALVVLRGLLMGRTPEGIMMSVSLPENDLLPFLYDDISLAAVNTSSLCILSGAKRPMEELEKKLIKEGIECMRLNFPRASHSRMMKPISREFKNKVQQVMLHEPKIPYISGLTGKWIAAEEAADPGYWARHLMGTIRFSDGIKQLLKEPQSIFVQVGSDRGLPLFVNQNLNQDQKAGNLVINLVRHRRENESDVYFLLNKIGEMWIYGKEIDWSAFYNRDKRYRVPLPTYPFERQHYPLKGGGFKTDTVMFPADRLRRNSDTADWFYIPQWTRSTLPPGVINGFQKKSGWLVFIGQNGLSCQLVEQLKKKQQDVITVEIGSEFKRKNSQGYMINPKQARDYDSLFKALQEMDAIPGRILHLWGISCDGSGDGILEPVDVTGVQDTGFYSLFYIAQAIGKSSITTDFQVAVVTNNMQAVTGGESLLPAKSTVLGAVKVIPKEYPTIKCRSIDILLPEHGPKENGRLINQLFLEFSADSTCDVVAYRGRHRWVQTFEQLKLESMPEIPTVLEEKGVYLVTGGLGGIGLTLAEYLVKTVKARLILTGRSDFPSRDDWERWQEAHGDDNAVSRKIQKLHEFENLGGKVLVFSADAADRERMEEVITRSLEQYGKINGIIHAAGLLDSEIIQLKKRKMLEAILSPKVLGTLVLDNILISKNIKPDFIILCSSLTSILGPFGQVGYAAANNFLDTFAAYKTSIGDTSILSINWDVWREVGMVADKSLETSPETADDSILHTMLMQGILPDEGIEVFRRIMGTGLSQVAVSVRDLNELIREVTNSRSAVSNGIPEEPGYSGKRYRRPDLGTPYAAPRDKLEQVLADIWQEYFGIDKVGIHDNFFKLGGDSLKGMKFVTRYKKLLEETVHTKIIFEAPTIAEVAAYFSHHYPEAVAKITGTEASEDMKETTRRIDAETLLKIRQSIPSPAPWNETDRTKNPKAIFIISPPQCGATLLRVMLAGHPKLFAPPDPGLLFFNSLDQMDVYFHSLSRTYMQIEGIDIEEAISVINEFRQQKMSAKNFYRLVQESIGEQVLVEKHPFYALSLDLLKRAEVHFENSLYIHLLRHPYGMIRSFEEAGVELFIGDQPVTERIPVPLSSRELAEVTWTLCNQNILEFLKSIPQERQFRIRFEDLVLNPRQNVESLCRFLRVKFHPGILQPYKDKKVRMSDDLAGQGLSVGDARFNKYKRIEPGEANNWRNHYYVDFLGDASLKIAETFRYKPIKSSDKLSIEPVEKKEYYNTSVGQKKFFIINEIENIKDTYNIPRVVLIKGELDRKRFEDAWHALIKRQESLCTSFHVINGQPVMKIHETVDFGVEYVEARGTGENQIESLLQEFISPFELNRAPLMRVKLVKLEHDKYAMFLDIHHIISDGFSMGLILNEFVALFGGMELPGLKIQYKDFAKWQQKFLESEECKKQEAYWLERFSGEIPLLNMPTDYPRPKVQSFDGERIPFQLETQLINELQKLGEDTGTTLYMILLAALNTLLSKYSGQKDIIIGAAIAGRDIQELETVIGVFMNVMPVRNYIEAEDPFVDFLDKVKQNLLMTFENHKYPLGELIEKMDIKKDLSRNPLNDVELVMTKIDPGNMDMDGLRLSLSEFNVKTSPVDITIEVIDSEDDIAFTLIYCTKLYKRSTMERFIDSFKEILVTISSDKDILLRNITISTGLGEAVTAFQDDKGEFGF